jgi:hypothetical protein
MTIEKLVSEEMQDYVSEKNESNESESFSSETEGLITIASICCTFFSLIVIIALVKLLYE